MSFGATTNATYTYDVLNRLTKITDSANLAVTYAYDAASRLTSRALPNGVTTTYSYDDLDRLTKLKDVKQNTGIADNNYEYNSANQIIQNIDQSGTHSYSYDVLDRLTAATYTGSPNESYAYDGVGNRTTSHKSATYGYQPFNRLTNTATASYLYNNNGNLTTKAEGSGTTQFAWDFENRLVQVVTPSSGSASYKYDALGRRIQRAPSSGASTNFISDGQDVVKDINSDGSTVEYLNGPGIDNKIRQKGSSTSTTYYFSQDHLGSTTALTGTTGKLVERVTYDGFGNSVGSTRTRYGFTGRERDPLTGLLHYRARSYDPQLGRFISEDPIGLAGGINQFAYVGNNPANSVDPTGLWERRVHIRIINEAFKCLNAAALESSKTPTTKLTACSTAARGWSNMPINMKCVPLGKKSMKQGKRQTIGLMITCQRPAHCRQTAAGLAVTTYQGKRWRNLAWRYTPSWIQRHLPMWGFRSGMDCRIPPESRW
jgi:RHS repeat-associated protein